MSKSTQSIHIHKKIVTLNFHTQRFTRNFSKAALSILFIFSILSFHKTFTENAFAGPGTQAVTESLQRDDEASTSSITHSSNAQPGELRKTDWQDMLPHTLEGSYYNEFWIYHIFLENDLHLHITFSLANFGSFKNAVSGGKLFISNFKGNNYHVSREYALEHLVIDEASHKIRLHSGRNIHVQGRLPEAHYITFQTEKHNVSYFVQLELYDIEPGYTAGDGIFRLEGHETGLFIHIPKARVKGTVAINSDTLEVNGTAYMDHTYQTDLSSKVIDKGFRFVSHTDDGYEVGYFLIPKRRSRFGVAGFGLQKYKGNLQLHRPEEVVVRDYERIGGRDVPNHVHIRYVSGRSQNLQRTADFQHVSFLEEVGGLRRRLVRNFLGGEVIEYVGKGRLNNTPVNYNFFIVH